MQSTNTEEIVTELFNIYFALDSKEFSEKLKQNFNIFEDLNKIEDPKIKAIGNFLYSVGLTYLAGKVGKYKIRDYQIKLNNKANLAIMNSLEYFKNTNEWKILEHIYDQLIYLFWTQISRKLVIIDERLKIYDQLIEYCKTLEDISEKLGDEAFLTKEERIPFRYVVGEFRRLLEKGTLSDKEADESNKLLKKKIAELENFNFPKAKFWAKKWKHNYVCDIEGNNKISFTGGTLLIDKGELIFSNDLYNRSIRLKYSIEPELLLMEQRAIPEMRFMGTGVIYTTVNPKIEQKYKDGLVLNFLIERPYKSKGDAFARDQFSIRPQRANTQDYYLILETDAEVHIQEAITLFIENDITLRINVSPIEIETENGITKLKYNLIEKIADDKGPKSATVEKKALDYMGYGKGLIFTFYCNINPTFTGTFIFTDPHNWKYCLNSCLYMDKLKFKQEWYPSFLNFDYSPILFLENGKIPKKFFKISKKDEFTGFLKDAGREFPGILKRIIIFGEFMAEYPVDERKKNLLDLINLMARVSHPMGQERSGILIITSDKTYYDEMKHIQEEINKINEKLTKIYRSTTITAINIEYISETELIVDTMYKNKKIYDRDYEEVYLIENPMIAFVLVPLAKYSKSAILLKDELDSKRTQKILIKAKQIWAIGNFEGVKIPKKANTKLSLIKNEDIQEDIWNINEIFKKKISEDYQKYAESDFLQRIYPGYREDDLLYNTILTSSAEKDFSFLTLASNYAANKPATINIIVDDQKFNKNEKEIIKMLGNLRFTESKMIKKENITEIGMKIRDTINPIIQKGIEASKNIILITKVPIPFELYDLEGAPLCISKTIGRVCSMDITDTSIMLTLNMMRRMIAKRGENILIIAPKYEGDLALPGAISEASILALELDKIFTGKISSKIDKIVNKEWLLKSFQKPLKIVHFSGHGAFIDNKSCLILSTPPDQDPKFLFPEDLEKMVEQSGIIKGYPLIFTSACITGKIQKASSGLEGLAAEFIKSGATCFIGTLWEIMDDSARELATQLYSSLNQLDKNFGELLLESRKNLHEKSLEALEKGKFFDPTCFAFILFGDPTIKIK
ncbi:MAG: CHAT domain-containing protein [Promethearchaeota archaeon]